MQLEMKTIRKMRGLTQGQLADMVDATKRQIGAWERGENDIPMDYAVAIADALNCSLNDLAGKPAPTSPALSPDERKLVDLFRRMDDEQKAKYLDMAPTFVVASEKDGAGSREDAELAGRIVR